MINNIRAIQKTYDKVNDCISRLMASHQFQNENKAFVILRASLKALRDRLTTEEALHLGAQLPALLRGFYFEGWNLNQQQAKIRTKEEFINDVRFHLNGHEDIDLDVATPLALKIILDMIDQGEAIEVLHQLPREIQELCPE
jgi:uncharacterized protein (DUF2267 family)